MSSDHVFGAYSLMPTGDGLDYILKTVHLDRDTGEMIYDECYIDAEDKNPISKAMQGQLSVRGDEFDVGRGEHKEVFESAVSSKEANEFERDYGVNREVYAMMTVMEDHFDMKNSPELVDALETRREGLMNNFQRDALCQPSKDYEEKVVATVVTKDALHIITEDGHMFEASAIALDGKDTLGAKDRSEAIHAFKTRLQAKGDVVDICAMGVGRNMAGAAMNFQTDPKTAGGRIDVRVHLENSREPLTHDLGLHFEMSDER